MIYSIEGNIVFLRKSEGFCFVVVKISLGLSFELKITLHSMELIKNKTEVFLYTSLIFKENCVEFFGFHSLKEKECFKMLTTVSGVGPAFALSILSNLTPFQLFECISFSDAKRLCECKGIGQKTAKRIILELKDKLDFIKEDFPVEAKFKFSSEDKKTSVLNEAIEALIVLGYGKKEASNAVYSQKENDSVENLVKNSLMFLSKK